MSEIENLADQTQERMQKTLDNLKKDFSKIRTGRATPDIVEDVQVEYYGSMMPVNQVATVAIPDARTITITPWEKTMVGVIEKAILASDLGLNPQSDGNLIRVPIPPLSEDRRRELAKNCKKIAEDAKVALRNIRRDSNEIIKKGEKDKEITKDDLKMYQDEIQKITDSFVSKVDTMLSEKEKSIMDD